MALIFILIEIFSLSSATGAALSGTIPRAAEGSRHESQDFLRLGDEERLSGRCHYAAFDLSVRNIVYQYCGHHFHCVDSLGGKGKCMRMCVLSLRVRACVFVAC